MSMIPLARGGYTDQEIKDVLHGKRGARQIQFRYDLLDKNDVKKKELTNVLGGGVSFAALNEIKRTARFSLVDDGSIDFLSDRIQPFIELKMSGGWISFPLGVFLLSSPVRKDDIGGVIRDVEAYDGLVILRDDKFDSVYTITAGTNYKTAITTILTGAGITKTIIEDTTKTLPRDVTFEIGTDKLQAVNNLIGQINFTPMRVDVNGYFITGTYVSPTLRAAEYTYIDDQLSVIYNGITEDMDLFGVANKWVVVRTNAELGPIKSIYTNSNPNSVTSTVSRGRTIADYREVQDIADQTALDAYVQRIAFEASQVYGRLEFETAIMPMHDYYDILNIVYGPLGINANYTEMEWSIPLDIGGKMKHSCRKVVSI
jgi:hypothetical protein